MRPRPHAYVLRPELPFEEALSSADHPELLNWRNDYVAVEQWSRFIRDDHYAYHTELHRQHEEFAKLWDKNLRLQGFADAFERQQQHA